MGSGVVLSISLSAVSFTFYYAAHKLICFSVFQHHFALHLPRQTNQHHCVCVCTTSRRISRSHVAKLKQFSLVVKLKLSYMYFFQLHHSHPISTLLQYLFNFSSLNSPSYLLWLWNKGFNYSKDQSPCHFLLAESRAFSISVFSPKYVW